MACPCGIAHADGMLVEYRAECARTGGVALLDVKRGDFGAFVEIAPSGMHFGFAAGEDVKAGDRLVMSDDGAWMVRRGK